MNTNCRRRIRSTIKWGGAVLTVLLLIMWVGSVGRVMVVGLAPTIIFGAIKGRAGIAWATPWTIVPNDFVARFDLESGSLDWWFEYEAHRRETHILAPIWFLILSCATPSFLIWRRDRKRLPGTCPKCGYSRTGLPADRACPECGAAVTPRT